MAYHLTLADHFTPDQLHQRYRACTDSIERAHWQIIWLKSQGKPTPAIAAVLGYSEHWVRTIIHRYNKEGKEGAEGLEDGRHGNAGAEPLLDEEHQAEVERALDSGKAPDGGLWTGPKIARWIERTTGRAHMHDQRGWDYLMRLGFSAQTPRPRHQQADADAQAAFKK